MSNPGSSDYRQHLELETPEHVLLDYELAGVGSRALAALVDWILVFGLVFVAIIGAGAFAASAHVAPRLLLAVLIVVIYGIIWGYFSLFEGLQQGQTPGKR